MTYQAELPYIFEFLTVKRAATTHFKLTCGPQRKGWSEWHAENLPGFLLEKGFSRYIIFSADGKTTFAVGKSRLEIKAWLYHLLPLSLMTVETKERMEIILRNYENYVGQLENKKKGLKK